MPRSAPRRDAAPPRVVITGIGLMTGLHAPGRPGPLAGRDETWAGLVSGRSAIRRLDLHDRDGRPYLGAPATTDDLPGLDPADGLLTAASLEAYEDAGLDRVEFDRDRAAAIVGLSKGFVGSLADAARRVLGGEVEGDALGRSFVGGWPSEAAHRLAWLYNLRGPGSCPIAACATGLVAVLRGAQLIRRGEADLVFAGAADASLEPMLLAAFRNMGALADSPDDPTAAVRPLDRRRSGFVVGEGAAIVILERDDHARARGILPYAEVAGGGLGADAHHITNLNPDPANLAGLIGRALGHAGVEPADIDHVNLHGTGTKVNDPLECAAIRCAFGPHADRLACTANKPQLGHLLGAAGAAELAITALSLRDGFVPPTLNLDDPADGCDLDATPRVGRSVEIRAALKLSLGFGGHLAAVVLRRPEGPRRPPAPIATDR